MASLVFNISNRKTTLIKDWIFKDIKVDLNKDLKNRDIQVNVDNDAIVGGITNMFLFAQGERIINPEFGNSLYKYIGEPINDLTARRIGREIIQMFERWEPRVIIQKVKVVPYENQHMYHIIVFYTVPSLSDEQLSFEASINARA